MSMILVRKAVRPALLACLLLPQAALSQSQIPSASSGNEIVVTPFRSETSIGQVGSAVTVIKREEIEKWGAQSLADVLRAVPGVSVTQNGGPAGLATLRLRGAEARHSMVMLDGVRIGDPSSTGGEFDFSALAANDIERIEILRGPQSALYGSEAMGGVVNIITRKGKRDAKASVSVEGGSYGTRAATASVSGGTSETDYALSVSGFSTDGFSNDGHNIPRITRNLTAPLEKDPAEKASLSARVGWQPQETIRLDAGIIAMMNNNHYDFGSDSNYLTVYDDPFNRTRNRTMQAWTKGSMDFMDGQWRSAVKLFANRTDRLSGNVGYYSPDYSLFGANALDYRGERYGIDWQNDVKLGALGKMVLGATTETETAYSTNEALPRRSSTLYVTGDASQSTQSVYAIHQIPLGDRLSLSLGGRVDHTEINDFATWRTTAAYLLPETDTKLRASVGTGAKSPSLYQRFSAYGSNLLQPEKNLGIDAGFDQDLFNKRVTASFTWFDLRYDNLINYGQSTTCTTFQNNTLGGCYFNVDRAHSYGFEQSMTVALIPDQLQLKSSYTFQIAQDEASHQALLRRPQHQGMVSLVYTGFERLEIEPRLYLVGHRADSYWDDASFSSIRTRLAPYARFDLRSSYKITETVSAYIRAENLTNAHYQDIYNYGITGRAFYVGAKATW